LIGSSDWDTNGQKDPTHKHPFCGSESLDRKSFKSPPPFSPRRTQHKRHIKSKRSVRPIFSSARPKATHLSLHYGGLSKLPETISLASDSDDSDDFPEVKDIISQSKYSSLFSSHSLQPAGSNTNSFTKKPISISEACDSFEKKYVLDGSDLRFNERLRSPSLEEECCPSHEQPIHRQKDPFDDDYGPGFSGCANCSASG
jgi:hypothetical protein